MPVVSGISLWLVGLTIAYSDSPRSTWGRINSFIFSDEFKEAETAKLMSLPIDSVVILAAMLDKMKVEQIGELRIFQCLSAKLIQFESQLSDKDKTIAAQALIQKLKSAPDFDRLYRAQMLASSNVPMVKAVVTPIILPLQVQANTAPKPPLSFYNLGNHQEIRFSVYSNQHPHAEFYLEVSSQPQPEIKIQHSLTSYEEDADAAKKWGHPAGEWVTRSLTPKDMEVLEKFLTTFRARGAHPLSRTGEHPAMNFCLVTKRMDKNGFTSSGNGQTESYNPSEEAMRDFIKNFIGYGN